MGPVIDSLYVEDGVLHITTQGVKKIVFYIGNRRENKVVRTKNGELVTEAEYKIVDAHSYIRVRLYDISGKAAYTNAFFVEDLLK